MLNFSLLPGPRERQLQRKLNNPLFMTPVVISQQDIYAAQQLDIVFMHQFMEQFRELVQRAVECRVSNTAISSALGSQKGG